MLIQVSYKKKTCSLPEFIVYAAVETVPLKAAKNPKPAMIQRCLDNSEGAQESREAVSLPSTRFFHDRVFLV